MSVNIDPDNRKVLFVCTGNVNRSPAAQLIHWELGNRSRMFMLHNAFGTSAATSDKSVGKITNKKMRDALERRGYKYNEVRSRTVNQAMIDEVKTVVYMADVHRKKLIAKFGMEIMPKLRSMGSYHPDKIGDIPDPAFDKDPAAFDHVVKLLEECMPNLMKEQSVWLT